MARFFRLGGWLRSVAAGAGLLFAAGCTDAPRQYEWAAPVKVDWPGKSVPTGDPIRLPEIPKEKSDDEKARENSRKPIVYATGAAGITFRTPLVEARELLSKPFYGPDASQGLAAYHEGIYVWWKAEPPRYPELMLIVSGYLGTLDAGPMGPIGLGRDLSAHFTEADPVGRAFLTKLYNQLEGISDPAFDCVAERICEITGSENDIVLSWPRLGLLVSRDRKVVYRMLLATGVPQGKLDAELDMLDGKILSEETTAELGREWGKIEETLGLNPETRVGIDWFGKDFSGVFLQLTKSRFEGDYLEPDPTERVEALTVYGGFKRPLRLAGERLALVPEGEGKAVVRLADGAALPEGGRLIELKMALRGRDQATVAVGLLNQLGEALFEKMPGGAIAAQLRGGFDDQADASLDGWIAAIPKEGDLPGRMVSLSLRRDSGDLSYVEVASLSDPVDKLLLPELRRPVPAGAKALAGFRIGTRLALKGVDRGRGEATLVIPGGTSAVETRVSFTENVALEGVFAGGQVEVQAVDAVRISKFGVTLGLAQAGLQGEDGSTPVAVVSVSSGAATGGIVGLCGMETLSARVGENDRAFKKKLDEATAKAAEEGRPGCRYVFQEDPNGSGRIDAIYFPEERVRIGLSRNEVASLLLYSNVREVLP